MSEQLSYAVILVGPPGCGKGTQASRLCTEKDFFAFSTGDAIRAEIASQSSLGLKLKAVCDAGGLVSDDIVLEMLKKVVDNLNTNKVLFDGFPRTIAQARSLSQLLDNNWKIRVYYFAVDDETVCERILGRFSCQSCGQGYNDKTLLPKVDGVCDKCGGTSFVRRSDDNMETLKSRLENYKQMTDPIVEFYKDAELLEELDASANIDEVWKRFSKSVDVFLKENFE